MDTKTVFDPQLKAAQAQFGDLLLDQVCSVTVATDNVDVGSTYPFIIPAARVLRHITIFNDAPGGTTGGVRTVQYSVGSAANDDDDLTADAADVDILIASGAKTAAGVHGDASGDHVAAYFPIYGNGRYFAEDTTLHLNFIGKSSSKGTGTKTVTCRIRVFAKLQSLAEAAAEAGEEPTEVAALLANTAAVAAADTATDLLATAVGDAHAAVDLLTTATNALAAVTSPPNGTSLRLNEIVVNDCETEWTDVDAECASSLDTGAAYHKVGTYANKCTLSATAAGICAYGDTPNATNGSLYTHVKLWIYSSLALTAGDFQVGASNSADFSTGQEYVDVPAVAQNTLTRVIIPLSAGIKALTSIDSIGLKLVADLGAVNIWIDDIRFCNYDLSGDDPITLPAATALDGEIVLLPWLARNLTFHQLPVDLVVEYRTCDVIGTLGAGDDINGKDYWLSTETPIDLPRKFSGLRMTLSRDLTSTEHLSLRAGG